MTQETRLTHQVEDTPEAVIVSLSGSIDCTHSNELSAILEEIREAHQKGLMLDFSSINYIDSSGLGVLVAERSRYAKLGRQFRICCLIESVSRVFQMSHLNRVFSLHETRKDALAAQ